MLWDKRSVDQIIEDNNWPPNPVVIKALVQTTMGTPATLYNGGMLRATVRYFDADEHRPGLPPDVAALVDELGSEKAGIHLVNTSVDETRRVIVQAGAFGEHSFTTVNYVDEPLDYDEGNPGRRNRADHKSVNSSVSVDGKHFSVELPPMTSIRLDCGIDRFSNDPSYAFPWHDGKVPIE